MEVCLRNVSTRGACIVASIPPTAGTIIELTGPFAPIVGRVKWAGEHRFGVEVQGQIDVAALVTLNGSGVPRSFVPAPGTRPMAKAIVPRPKLESRHVGNFLQFGFVAFLAGCAATFMAQVAYETLSQPSAAIAAGLAQDR